MTWLSGYSYRKKITINGSATGAQTDYALKLYVYKGTGTDSGNAVYLNDHCKVNFDDIRFTKSDGSTELTHWLQEFTENDFAVFWIKFDSLPQSAAANFYIYYDNSSASSAGDGHNTFSIGDDFDDGATTGLTINLAGSAVAEVPTITKLLSKVKVDDWIKCYQHNPVLAVRAGKWDAQSVRDLSPVKDENGYLVYESGKVIALYDGTASGVQPQVGRATSSDRGLTWGDRLDSPVIAFGAGGSWYEYAIESTSVIKRASDGVYIAFCGGYDASLVPHLGAFTSNDLGVTWSDQGSKVEKSDFTHPLGAITQMSLPWVVKRETDYIMLFEAMDSTASWRIFAATAPDLLGPWTHFNGGNPIISLGTAGQWDDFATANPKLVKLATDEYLLAYNGRRSGTNWQVGFATATTDLTSWTKHTGNPVIVGEGTGWEQTHTECSAMVKDESTYLRFWYQGFDAAGNAQIGYAKNHQGRLFHCKSTAVADGWIVGSMQASAFWASVLLRHTGDASNTSGFEVVLDDFGSVPSPMLNTDWNPQERLAAGRNSPTEPTNPNKFSIVYYDTGGTGHLWNGSAWQAGAAWFGGPGLYEIRIWDDGTNFNIDLLDFWSGASLFTSVATIAKASVKAFSLGRALCYTEQFTNYYYLGQYFDNVIVRKYVSPEPTWGTWGSEESMGSPGSGVFATLLSNGEI